MTPPRFAMIPLDAALEFFRVMVQLKPATYDCPCGCGETVLYALAPAGHRTATQVCPTEALWISSNRALTEEVNAVYDRHHLRCYGIENRAEFDDLANCFPNEAGRGAFIEHCLPLCPGVH